MGLASCEDSCDTCACKVSRVQLATSKWTKWTVRACDVDPFRSPYARLAREQASCGRWGSPWTFQMLSQTVDRTPAIDPKDPFKQSLFGK